MLKILILAKDPGSIKLLIPNIHIIDEPSIRESTGFNLDPDTAGYGPILVSRVTNLVKAWKGKRPLAIILDMRYHTAVDQIPHDVSCLVYDGSKSKRLAYNCRYKTDVTIENIDEINRLTDILEAV